MNPVEKAVFLLTRAILGNKKARTAFILYACALHLLVMYTTWECALSGSSQDQFQRQRNPFVRPLSALTILGLLNHFLLVMIRLLLYMRIVFGYYTLHNIIYIALHAPLRDHHANPQPSLTLTMVFAGSASPLERPGYVGKPTPCLLHRAPVALPKLHMSA